MLYYPPTPSPVRFFLLGLAFGLAACDRPDAPPDDTPPVFEGAEAFMDDGADAPDFAAFRDSVRIIVANRDTSALLGLVAESAQLSYDDVPSGPKGLRALWFDSETSRQESIWTVFDRILSAGSVEEDGAFTVPYVAGLWPQHLDPFGHVAASGDTILARATPNGPVVAHLTGVFVLPLADSTTAEAWHVTLPDGSTAYLSRASAVSPVGYRATFWPLPEDGWKLRIFVSGE